MAKRKVQEEKQQKMLDNYKKKLVDKKTNSEAKKKAILELYKQSQKK